MNIAIKKNHIIIILIVTNLLSIFLIYNFVKPKYENNPAEEYTLLSEKIAWLSADDFVNKQKELMITYADMKQQVVDYFNENNLNNRYSLYFEDLTTGAWIGLAEREKFIPASLLKTPTMVAILKKVEKDEISLNQNVILAKDVIDNRSGTLYTKGEGYEINVRGLLNYLVNESDNTALNALNRLVSDDEYATTRLALGLPHIEPDIITMLSPKEISNVFRSLYFSTYLRRTFSELALSILSDTEYNTQLTAGVPSDVKVAHKYGAYQNGGYFHDCGIIYLPKKPYMLCVMSKDSSKGEADKMISGLSSIIYNYLTK